MANLINAVTEAMEDFISNGREFTKTNPTINIDNAGDCYYGSSQHGDTVVCELDCGFGSWEPECDSDVGMCAEGFAKSIQE